jgi:hypothetical protein
LAEFVRLDMTYLHIPAVLYTARRGGNRPATVALRYEISISAAIFSRTSSSKSAGARPAKLALRTGHDKLRIWSASTTPATPWPLGIGTSKG